MTLANKTLALSLITASAFCTAPAVAELSANVGATSNYLWRGITQTHDEPAVQGGLDLSAGGAYAGLWTSNVNWRGGSTPNAAGAPVNGPVLNDYELDVYGGYRFNAGAVGLDLGAIAYTYPIKVDGMDDSFYEGYLGASAGAFSAKVSYSPDINLVKGSKDESGTYVEAAYAIELNDKASLNLHAGNYSGGGVDTVYGSSFSDFSISLTKDEFTLGISKTSGLKEDFGNNGTDANGARVFVAYKKGFSL